MVKWVKFNPIKWNNVPSEKTIKNHIKDNNIFEEVKELNKQLINEINKQIK